MTVVLTNHFLSGVAIIADCRVSYGTGFPVHDGLQKLYPIGKHTVLGFSGPLAGACQVIEAIRKHRSRQSERVAAAILLDVERWIRHAYRNIRSAGERKNLSFLLASVEPNKVTRFAPGIKAKFNLPDIPRCKTFALVPSPGDPSELVKQQRYNVKVIGVKEDAVGPIRVALTDRFVNQFHSPRGEEVIRGSLEALRIARDNHPETVGGLFQCAILDAEGVGWADYEVGEIALKTEAGRYVQHNKITGEKKPLLTVWEWRERHGFCQPPGASDVFDLSGLA